VRSLEYSKISQTVSDKLSVAKVPLAVAQNKDGQNRQLLVAQSI